MSAYSIKAISGKERKILIESIMDLISQPEILLPKKGIFRYILNKKESAIVNKKKDVILLELNNRIIPSLKFARTVELLVPKITVDLGAIKFVTNGADIMRPGITIMDETVREGKIVLVVEERKSAPLCIGIAMYDFIDMKNMKSGKCIKNLHYLGDHWWSFNP